MLIKNVTREQVEAALAATSKIFEDNIIFNRFDAANRKRTRFNVTLRTQDSKKAGHKLGQPKFMGFSQPADFNKRKRLHYACWHVHGTFFDELFKINPETAIKSGSSSGWITTESGNWCDRNIGSQMNPYYFSEACDCE